MLRNLHKARSLLPLRLRCTLQEHSLGRSRRWRKLPGIERATRAGKVALTFDDGPDPASEGTTAVLEALDLVGARATFFLVGEQIERSPDLAREILARGHEVGVHGQRHFRHDRVPSAESVADIENGHTVVTEIADQRPRFYRPPYGKLTPAGAEACRRLDLEVAYWSTWGLDWEPLRSDRISKRVIRDLDEGAIILLHDSASYATRGSALETARAIGAIAHYADERELELVTLGEACGDRLSEGSSVA
jgi:peptidoglycan/xylan/chitin deacetylase (PgdA/CDA1 family)